MNPQIHICLSTRQAFGRPKKAEKGLEALVYYYLFKSVKWSSDVIRPLSHSMPFSALFCPAYIPSYVRITITSYY